MAGHNADFMTQAELDALGFRHLGRNVRLHRTAVLVEAGRVSIGDDVRIDPFTLLSCSGGITIGHNVHIAAGVALAGQGLIVLEDYVGLSGGVRVLSSTDDFSGRFMTGPTLPDAFTSVTSGQVTFGRHVVVGTGSIVMPGCTLGEGSAVGALSFVNQSLDPWTIYAGAPLRRIKERRRDLLELERQYEAQHRG